MLNVNVTITGDKDTIRKLQKLEGKLVNWKPELEQVGDFLGSFYSSAVFTTEGGAFGLRWASLSPQYELAKRKEFPGRGILERTSVLRKSINKEVGNNFVEVGFTADHAKYHQFGTRRMPARPLVHIDSKLKDKVIDIFKEGLITKIRKAYA